MINRILLTISIILIGCNRDTKEVVLPGKVGFLVDSESGKVVGSDLLEPGPIEISETQRLILLNILPDTISIAGNGKKSDSSVVKYKTRVIFEVQKDHAISLYSLFRDEYKERLIEPEVKRLVREHLKSRSKTFLSDDFVSSVDSLLGKNYITLIACDSVWFD